MSTASSELIEQFAIETQEHLDAIEPILLQAEWTPPDKPAIAAKVKLTVVRPMCVSLGHPLPCSGLRPPAQCIGGENRFP